ncbi:2,3,4,5-tetrahydropyridine-2,6-dicarboxylate N-succinyltransferase [Zooshikella ganghwensis]|uniref:2,3,4,5-tetrahydropyridine-2,6-dicarboxylate N-succinyltransferase n=1 Tax=Zooshikella ganghwensis TaxID=202772 RepID=A0A4P9VNN3_9GAMM|nr:2,3,4,5-tetrahydropyridine-2,6-dicarboxylate N-succinyltransferase [Zooshikella ganghwensis]RDH45033.1 2,3,4,5-tetrahydropyridine-2,6-dicarboxylate N-succinyltransferase [Zooshikella ganghwensis]
MSKKFFSLAIGIGSKNSRGEWLEVYYPNPILSPSSRLIDHISAIVHYEQGNTSIELTKDQLQQLAQSLTDDATELPVAFIEQLMESEQPIVLTLLESDAAPTSTPEAYLKLHLLSHRLVKPHGTNLSGIFSLLPNVAWTNQGAIDLAELPQHQLKARLSGQQLQVFSVDKFPKMTDYVVPKGVRIADTARVRLGAYLGEGTTIMHEGFVNFNAGTVGKSMVEGRISAGVIVGEASDLGGGCSTMGTLSGGNNIVIAIGEQCLIGANAGVGIPLGDRCTIEAGLYITAGAKVQVLDENNQPVKVVKARELAGQSDLLFRRNSLTGALECKTNRSAIALNEELHAHN